MINGNEKTVLVDTGMGLADIKAAVTPYAKNEITVLNTHWHFDHIGGNHHFENIGISSIEKEQTEKNFPNTVLQSYIHNYAKDMPFPDDFDPDSYSIRGSKVSFIINHGDIFDLGSRYILAIATPGHTHGSMSFLDSISGFLFCGDLLYNGPLYIQFAESSFDEYCTSLERIRNQSQIKRVYPSHGEAPLPLEYINQAYLALMRIKAGEVDFSEELMKGVLVRFYDVDGVQVYMNKPGTVSIDMREMVE